MSCVGPGPAGRYQPLYDEDPPGLYEKILRHPVEFPPLVSPLARDVMVRLLTQDRLKRLGHKGGWEVTQHKWYAPSHPTSLSLL